MLLRIKGYLTCNIFDKANKSINSAFINLNTIIYYLPLKMLEGTKHYNIKTLSLYLVFLLFKYSYKKLKSQIINNTTCQFLANQVMKQKVFIYGNNKTLLKYAHKLTLLLCCLRNSSETSTLLCLARSSPLSTPSLSPSSPE